MRKIINALVAICAMAWLLLGSGRTALAEAVDGTWENADTFGDGPYSTTTSNTFVLGEDPDDPSINSNWATQEMIFSPFTQMTLANPGDKVVFTGSILLTGTTNSPLSSGTPRTQFRFGLFQSNANTDETGWTGYYMSNKHGNSGSPQGILAVKPVGNTSAFLSVTGQVGIASQNGDGTEASLFNDGTYNLMMSIERDATGQLVLNSSIIGVGNRPATGVTAGDFNGDGFVNAADYVTWRMGGPLANDTDPPGAGPEDYAAWRQNYGHGPAANQFAQIMNGTHTTASTAGTYTFDRLGFLLGQNLGTDRAAFSNLDVTFIPAPTGSGSGTSLVPEPATTALFALAAMLFAGCRRRTVSSRPSD